MKRCSFHVFMKTVLLTFLVIVCVSSAYSQDPKFKRSIFFGGGSYYIDEDQRADLIHFLDSIPNLQEYTITIHSHTDNRGGVAFNEWLSEMRSFSAIELLENAVEIRDFGQHNPLYDNSTLEGRLKNRRVDIIFWPIAM